MTFAALVAPEIDRLVLAVNTAIGDHPVRVVDAAARAGLDSPELLKHFAEFLLADGISEDLAISRLPYLPPDAVPERVATWRRLGLVEESGGRLRATPPLVPVLEALLTERREVAGRLWSGHEALDGALDGAGAVIGALGDEFRLAVAHRRVTEPADDCLRLHHRLTTLRYVRSRSHVEAWRSRGLERTEIMALTALWHGSQAEDGPVLSALADRGLVDLAHSSLSEEGRRLREEIEADTNRAAEPVFEVLGEEGKESFHRALTALPGVPT